MGELGENVRFNKLLLEFKASYPSVADEVVRNCVKLYGHDKHRCNEVLSAESERAVVPHSGPAYNRVPSAVSTGASGASDQGRRRLSLQPGQALLNQQMQRHLMLRDELNRESKVLDDLRGDVSVLEHKLTRRQIKLRDELSREPPQALESKVNELEDSCKDLADQLKLLQDGPTPKQSPASTPDDVRKPSLEAAFASVLGPVAGTGLPVSARLQDPLAVDVNCAELASSEDKQWPCTACTYLNHPLLKSCEQCSMPRFMTATADSSIKMHPDDACFCHPQNPEKSNNNPQEKKRRAPKPPIDSSSIEIKSTFDTKGLINE